MDVKINMSELKSIDKYLGYYDQQVLAAYRNEPHKYKIESDYFEGELALSMNTITNWKVQGKSSEVVSIRFGYRTLRDGNLAIVAWLPDLFNKSNAHVQKWSAISFEKPRMDNRI